MFSAVFAKAGRPMQAVASYMSRRITGIVAAALLSLPAAIAQADPILTITPNDGAAAIELDRAALEALPRVTIRTRTIWTEGVVEFEGVSLATLVAETGLDADAMSFVALNEYAVSIPLADAVEGGPIVADRMNGAPMSVRDKGPLWLIYPFDDNSDYQTEQYYSRSIWQLHRIEPAS